MQIQPDRSASDGAGPRYTVDEVRSAIAMLSDADLARLQQAAKVFSGISGIMEDDLIQESYTRALEGRRTCDRSVGIIAFLCGVMKSIASQESEARKAGMRPVTVVRNGEVVLPDGKADAVSPEEAAAAAIDDRPLLDSRGDGAAGRLCLEWQALHLALHHRQDHHGHQLEWLAVLRDRAPRREEKWLR